MSPEATKWWVDTLKKVADTKKWQEGYIKRNLHAGAVDGR
jgi:tripartite-type tricarboxylate transporter receptor subunit TctC